MKPRNFPARKLARKLAADVREAEGYSTSAREQLAFFQNMAATREARAIRTKKRRA